MASKRELIMQAVKAALTGTSGVGSRVYRSRADKFGAAEAPAINIMPDSEDPTENTIGKVDAKLNIEVQVYHRSSTTPPDEQADSVVEEVFSRLMADSTLGGLAVDISETGTNWDFDESDRTALLVRMRFAIWYRHNRNSLTS